MENILEKIINKKKERIKARQEITTLTEIIEKVESELEITNSKNGTSFFEAIKNNPPSIISEIKKASPSKGVLNKDLIPAKIASSYETSGASAISVLTEEDFFLGSDKDLQEVRASVSIPILRKDFVIDEYQVWESKLLGADAVLLICAALNAKELQALYNTASRVDLNVLFEVHNEEELQTLLSIEETSKPKIVGVNNRNLKTFEVSLENSKSLINKYKSQAKDSIWVSESGISSDKDIKELYEMGFSGFLVGESLVKSSSPSQKLKHLLRN